MKRIALFASALALVTIPAFGQPITVDAKTLETLQARIAALESRVRDLESTKTGAEKGAPSPEAKAPAKDVPTAAIGRKEPPAPQRRYTIQEGDTVSEIARKHGVPRSAFMEANNIREGQQIYIGEQVTIPSPPSATRKSGAGAVASQKSSTPASTGHISYTIKYGDTLSSIARKHNVSVEAIKRANGMSSDRISGGQTIKIPAKGGSPGTVAGNSRSASPGKKDSGSASRPGSGQADLLRPEETYGLYTVEKGDTLFSLARDFFTTEKELQRLNEMGASTVLRPGKDMVVPTSKYFEHHKLAGN